MHPFDLAPQPPLPFAAAVDYSDTALALSAGGWPEVAEHRDLRFGDEAWQVMDIFAPSEPASARRDVLVFFHGGGWTNGYKEWCGFMAPALAARGVILVAPTHRLAPDVRFPVFIEDALAAIAAARLLVADLGGDPDRLFISGHSAGGHVAAMCALKSEWWERFGLPSHSIRAALPVSGILDLHHADPPPGSLEARVYEAVLEKPEDDRVASPLTWLGASSLPFFLAWGERDSERVRRSNGEAANMARSSGASLVTRQYPEDHFGTHLALKDPAHDWYDVLDTLRKETR